MQLLLEGNIQHATSHITVSYMLPFSASAAIDGAWGFVNAQSMAVVWSHPVLQYAFNLVDMIAV